MSFSHAGSQVSRLIVFMHSLGRFVCFVYCAGSARWIIAGVEHPAIRILSVANLPSCLKLRVEPNWAMNDYVNERAMM